MNTSITWQGEYKTTQAGIEIKIRTQGNGSGWIWKAREIISNHYLAVSKPIREFETAKEEAERWLSENGKAG